MHRLKVNGKVQEIDADPGTPLLWVIREQLGLTGTKFGCGIARCGACTVHVDGEPVRSCSFPLSAADGKEITTIEGLSPDRSNPLQQAWIAEQVPQCGYCQSGMLMTAAALLKARPTPTDEEIDFAMTNLCRCGTYSRVRKAIKRASGIVASVLIGLVLTQIWAEPRPALAAPADAREAGLQAFDQVAAVLRHPRCLNCHTTTNFPRQGDDRHPHVNLVRRGLDDRGVPGMRCAACHQSEENLASGVPGRPSWRLAPLSMGWEGLSKAELCLAFKDQRRNGGRSPEALAEHLRSDPLVSYGWNPGGGRTPVPVPREELARLMDVWVQGGAPCPR